MEAALQEDGNFAKAILDTVGALIVVLDPSGRIVRFNSACERITGYSFDEVKGQCFWDVFLIPEEIVPVKTVFQQLKAGNFPNQHENYWVTKDGTRRCIAWSNTVLLNGDGSIKWIMGTGIDMSDRQRAEAALKETEKKYQVLYNNALEGIVINELVYNQAGEPIDYRIVDVNPQYEAILDIKREQAIGRYASDIYGTGYPPYLEIFAAAAQTGVPTVFETHFDPMQKVFRIAVFSIGGNQFAVAFEDITASKVQEEALIASEQRFQKLGANIPGTIYQYRLVADGSYSYPYMSQGCRELFEIEPVEVQKNPSLIWEMLHPDDVKLIADSIALSAETLQPWQSESRIVTPSGRVKWIQGVSRPEKQENGDIIWDGVVIDITERKLAEAALAESEARYRSVVDTSPDAIVVMDTELNIYICNRQAEVLFGYEPGEMVGKNGLEFLVPESRQRARENTLLTLEFGSTKNIEYEMVKKDGSQFPAEVSSSFIKDGEGVGSFMVVARDISDRKAAEIALQTAMEELEMRVEARTAELKEANDRALIEIAERLRAEEALRASESRFRTMFEQSPLSISIYSPQGQTLQINRAYEQMWGLSFENLDNYNILHDEQLVDKGIMPYIQRGFAGSSCEIPALLVGAGSKCWVRAFIYPVKDEAGNIREVILIEEDISDRVAAEEALKESEARLQSILDNSPAVVYLKDREGKYLFVNSSIKNLFDKTKEEIVGQSDRSLFPPDIAEALQANDRRVWQTEMPLQFEENAAINDGIRTYLSIKFPLYNAAGVAYAICGISTDISDRKLAEVQLQESEERFRAIFEQAAVGIAIVSLKGQFLRINKRFSEILGYSQEELRSLSFSDITHPDDVGFDRENIRRLLANEISTYNKEKRYFTKEKRVVWGNLTLSLVRDANGEPKCFIALVADISDRKALEKELSLRQSRFDAFFAAAPAGLVIFDNQLRFVQINPTLAEIHGLPVRDHIGKQLSEVLPELAPRIEPMLRRIIATGEANLNVEISGENPTQPGEIRHWVVSHFPLPGEDGKPLGVGSVVVDITERKRAEAARAESEERYRTLAKNFPNGAIFLFDKNSRYILAEGTELAAIGLPKEMWEGKTIWQVMPPEVCETVVPLHRAAFAGEETIYELPFGSRLYLLHVLPVKNERGEILGGMAIAQNITERKRLERELAWREQMFNSFISWAPLGIAIFDRALRYLHINDTLAAENGLPPEAHMGKTLREIQPHLAPTLEPMYRRILATGEPVFNAEVSGETPRYPGVLRHWVASYFPLPDTDGSPWGIGAVLIEISDRVRAEEALRDSEMREREKSQQLEVALIDLQQTQTQLIQTEKMSSLGQLVAGVAHEINNPVSFIYGNVDPAMEYIRDLLYLLNLYQQYYPSPPAEILEHAEAIDLDFLVEDLPKLLSSMKLGADRIREIVLSLRNFSRLDESAMKPVDIHQGIDSTLMILQNRLKETAGHPGIQVIKNYGKVPPVECYAGQINQVFMNLIANAIDALEEYNKSRSLEEIKANPPAIAIRTSVKEKGTLVEISIADNGHGMTDEVRKRLFDPFFTTKPVGKGTGLGLSISYQIIVEKHRGNLICHSQPKKGAEFVITIPIQPQNKG